MLNYLSQTWLLNFFKASDTKALIHQCEWAPSRSILTNERLTVLNFLFDSNEELSWMTVIDTNFKPLTLPDPKEVPESELELSRQLKDLETTIRIEREASLKFGLTTVSIMIIKHLENQSLMSSHISFHHLPVIPLLFAVQLLNTPVVIIPPSHSLYLN